MFSIIGQIIWLWANSKWPQFLRFSLIRYLQLLYPVESPLRVRKRIRQMTSFADPNVSTTRKPPHDYAPLIRTGNMAGPGETNWILSGQLLCGGHPGVVSNSNLVKNLESILQEDINLFVCLQEELSTDGHVHIASGGIAGANLVRKRNAYGLRYASSCGPYLSEAKLVAGRLRQSHHLYQEQQPSIHFMHFPITEANEAIASDGDTTACVQRILSAIAAGDRVYLHCSDGNGRTGTIAALVLGVIHGLSSSESLTLVDMYRTHRRGIQGLAVETHQQKALVHRLLSNTEWRDMMCDVVPKTAAATAPR